MKAVEPDIMKCVNILFAMVTMAEEVFDTGGRIVPESGSAI